MERAMALEFQIDARCNAARTGRLMTPHGEVETPVFMPVGTLATVKAVPQETLEELGAQLVLANTYHLYLRPGVEAIRAMGGLHAFMGWERALLTDSGGFQVFSLSPLRKLGEAGVEFRSHRDGSTHTLTPESATEAQVHLGADIIMAFDECTEYPAPRQRAKQSLELTLRWAARSKKRFEEKKHEVPWRGEDLKGKTQALFGIVQGGMHMELRRESAERTVAIGFDGYAIGGLSVGEPRALTFETLSATLPLLPGDRPRYVMGVGTPEEIVEYAALGVDMMDCVLPTRAARHGLLYTSEGRVNIKNAAYARDERPLDPNCGCRVCARYSRAYLRHLYASGEPLAQVLNSLHNLAHYLDTMRAVRHSIKLGDLSGLLSGVRARVNSKA
jgi:queuine tRNA-ribosyltransferase